MAPRSPNVSLPKCDDEKNVSLLKLLVYCGIDFNKINSTHFKHFFTLFAPSYKIPDVSDLKDKIFHSAYDNLHRHNHSSQISNVIGVLACNYGEEDYAVSFLLSRTKEYIYITDIVINNEDSDVITELENFCDLSVQKASDTYSATVHFVIYGGSYLLKRKSEVNGSKYNIITSFTTIIRKLKDERAPCSQENIEDINKSRAYTNAMEIIEEKLTDPNYILADALEDLLKLIDDGFLSINPYAFKDIITLLNPVCLAANYFVHKFKGHFFTRFDVLNQLMYDFLFDELPNQAFDGLANYKNSQGTFSKLFDPSKTYDIKRFWCIAKLEEKSISEYALSLVDLPATLKKIDVDNLRKLTVLSEFRDSETFKGFLTTLYLNEY